MNEEYPVQTDPEAIKRLIQDAILHIQNLEGRLDRHAEGINAIGENMNWLVQNVQGIFQMFASPQFMSQMTNMLSGVSNAPGPSADSEPAGTPVA
jgi:hypothetical protein